MRITLMHNPKAGTQETSRKELLREFERAGHKVTYHSTKEAGFCRALSDPGDMVVVAGGDGTVGEVAAQLVGREVPMAILPLGTANNIGRALGLDGSAGQLIRSLVKPRVVSLDVGIARGPWGEKLFIEGAGTGLFPRMMAEHARNKKRGIPDAVDELGGVRGGIHFMHQVLQAFRGPECVIRVDGKELRGKFLLIEVLNIPTIGPALELAPRANPGDGYLDVVTVREGERRRLDSHLAANLTNEGRVSFKAHRIRQVTFSCSPTEFHFDDEC